MYCYRTCWTNIRYLFMAATSDVIWIEHVIILVVIFRCYYGSTTYPILSRCQTYSTFTNRIYSIRWADNYVRTGDFCFKEPFDIHQLITFIFIWIGIVLYSISQYIKLKKSP